MDPRVAVLAAVIIVIIILLLPVTRAKSTPIKITTMESTLGKSEHMASTPIDANPKTFSQMTGGEQVEWIIKTYFSLTDDGIDTDAARVKAENEFIQGLPANDQCPDLYDRCPEWAANDECTINPEWMLNNCPKSCQSCSLTPQQKEEVTRIYNSRPPVHCVYHGKNYPGDYWYLNRLMNYKNRSTV